MNKIPDIYFSFFMFTTDLKISQKQYREEWIKRINDLYHMGYKGFELPIGGEKGSADDYALEIEQFRQFRAELDAAGLQDVMLTTNVGATASCDPSSSDPAVRLAGVEYLQSRIAVTAALRGKIMMGPLVIPYGEWIPKSDKTEASSAFIWSDELQAALQQRYKNAEPEFIKLGQYAQQSDVKLAIEPITHWETPGFNTLAQLLPFLQQIEKLADNNNVGAVIDSAHEVLDGSGAQRFAEQVSELASMQRLHYAQASPPDRGALYASWLPWEGIFTPIFQHYNGPIAVEIFNAIPAFTESMRITRKKYWIPDQDPAGSPELNAYSVAERSLNECTQQFALLLHHT